MAVYKPLTYTELMSIPDETREQAYRRGYLAGYKRATYDAGSPTQMIHFWHNLIKWLRNDTDRFIEPPTLRD